MPLRALPVLLLLAGCAGPPPEPPPPGPSPAPAAPALVLQGRAVQVVHLVCDPDRRFVEEHLARLGGDRGVLCSWDHDRFIHLFAGRETGAYDAVFLASTGAVVDVQAFPSDPEVGVTSAVEARHALVLPGGWAAAQEVRPGVVAGLGEAVRKRAAAPMTVVRVAGVPVHVETSHLGWQRMRGLMHRPRMSKEEGMLFLYPDEDTHGYWMRHTLMPLDISYFRADGSPVNVCRMQVYKDPARDEEPRAPSQGVCQFVLELNLGWYDARKLIDAEGRAEGAWKLEVPEAVRALAVQAD